jgi:two-component system response regulator AtoC
VRGDFPELIDEQPNKKNREEAADEMETSGKLPTLDEVEEMYIRKILKKDSSLNKGEVCEILGISRPTLERKLEKYGIVFERE